MSFPVLFLVNSFLPSLSKVDDSEGPNKMGLYWELREELD